MDDIQNKKSGDGGKTIASVKIDEIVFNPNRPRRYLNPKVPRGYTNPNSRKDYIYSKSLQSLVESIKMVGVLQPILVQKDEDGKIHLIAGERRVRAAKVAGKTKIPAIFIDPAAKVNFLALSLIENSHNRNLTPLDEAEAVMQLKSKYMFSDRVLKLITGKTKKGLKEIWQINSLSKRVKDRVLHIEYIHEKAMAKGTLIRLAAMEDDDEKMFELDKYRHRWPRPKEDIAKDKIKELNKTLVSLKEKEEQGNDKYKIERELYDLADKIGELVSSEDIKDTKWKDALRRVKNQISRRSRSRD